jgi:PPM family protein phosphatase
VHYQASGRTDIGCVRKNNEDSFYADHERGLFIVCDGMGGHAAGEVASATAVKTIVEALSQVDELRRRFADDDTSDDDKKAEDAAELMRACEEAVQTAGKAIFDDAREHPERAGMGTTCSVLLLAGKKGILAHVGDSRIYVVRRKALYQLSEDHTFVAEQVRRGAMTKEQAAKSKKSNVLTRALGPIEQIPVDMMMFDVDAHDRFLVCSDGLHNYFTDSTELLRMLIGSSVEVVIERIVDTAKERGGHDNITAILVDVEDTHKPNVTDTAAGRIAVLKRVPLFQHMTYQELVKVLSVMQSEQHAAGHVLIEEDTQDDRLYVNLQGDLEVHKAGKLIAQLPSGAHVGEMALIDRAPRSATVKCKTPANVLVMDRPLFHELIRKEAAIGTKMLWAFTQELSKRLRDTNEHLAAARGELDERGVDVPFDEDEVADISGD